MKIVISGLGVMGASLAMALKRSGHGAYIFGYDKPGVTEQALDRHIIDKGINNWPGDCRDADFVFLATPIRIIEQHLRELNGVVGPNTIVSDLGSTKKKFTDLAAEISFSASFIAGHPMTGAEKSGLAAANPLLYENAVYILCPLEEQEKSPEFERLADLLQSIKSRIYILSADQHDEILAYISHLPQVVALALVNMVGAKEDEGRHFLQLSAGGFRDLTRIASSSPDIWQDIISSNKLNLQKALDGLINELNKYNTELDDVNEIFGRAHNYRERIPKKGKGFMMPLVDVSVYVDDQVGVIAKISQALFAKNIDIRDIELLKIREKEGGVFRLSFTDRDDAKKAISIMREIGFDAAIRE